MPFIDVSHRIRNAGGSLNVIDDIEEEVRRHLDSGGRVNFIKEGKPLKAVGVSPGSLRDVYGQSWGIMAMSMPLPQFAGVDGIELLAAGAPDPPPPFKPGQHKPKAMPKASVVQPKSPPRTAAPPPFIKQTQLAQDFGEGLAMGGRKTALAATAPAPPAPAPPSVAGGPATPTPAAMPQTQP